jgi:hypothetical protein
MRQAVLDPKNGGQALFIEYRQWYGVRTAFVSGRREPVWYVAALAKRLGHVGRTAKRLRWRNYKLIRLAIYHAEWNAFAMEQEREAAIRGGFPANALIDSPHQLIVPQKQPSSAVKRRRRKKRFPEPDFRVW